MRQPPENLKDLGSVYSNFDHEMDPAVEAQLANGDGSATHPAWNYHGQIWKDGDRFFELVRRFGVPVEVFEGESVADVVAQAVEEFGGE